MGEAQGRKVRVATLRVQSHAFMANKAQLVWGVQYKALSATQKSAYLNTNPLHANSPMHKASTQKYNYAVKKQISIKQKDRAANENDSANVFAFGRVVRRESKNKHLSKGDIKHEQQQVQNPRTMITLFERTLGECSSFPRPHSPI